MIKTVKISNFKSVQELEIELGRLNVFIGENGCGKTSILEGIAIAGAVADNKIDPEFLRNRGIRVTDNWLMKSAFQQENIGNPIKVWLNDDRDFPLGYTIKFISDLNNSLQAIDTLHEDFVVDLIESTGTLDNQFSAYIKANAIDLSNTGLEYRTKVSQDFALKFVVPFSRDFHLKYKTEYGIIDYLIFAPENYFLRNFDDEGQIRPLGIRGEGLFRHLVELSKEEPETFIAIANYLSLIDWFGGLNILSNPSFSERRLSITDRFIADTIKDFDQRSANEGFLYLLFYFTLFLSKYTPKFFAIDNIDNALNPRLCVKLVETLAKISKEQDKQAILTTHNPAILDGLDLADDEQRLFVIYRNADGETTARRIMPLKTVAGAEPVRLSEAFVRGYLGGLPSNF